jgi:preprotein translocase subunit SecE
MGAVPANGTDSGGLKNAVVADGPARTVKKQQTFVSRKTASEQRADRGKIRGYIDKSIQFLREVKVELKKVTWPSRKQTMGSTVVVLILVMIISVFLGVADIGLSSLIRVVLQ